ncbi:hypothetical protein M422DRAFT_37500 [Sphaerobolus stellatus SS14]|uniref:F-box domain-containing protein n=1 Tax=Sphaerobolus stellatus (strain SS14) TaxID=990650 RepID=A0A0C9UG68_SPHS4|nr:hypothetical protein M422DRAFT_37500 [Sphaerobolus stellatus SS14]
MSAIELLSVVTRGVRSSPIQRLPSELLIDIWLLCLSGYQIQRTEESPGFAVYQNHRDRYFITSVCRRWRELVRSTPIFWHTLALDFPFRNADHLQDWILFSRFLPLNVRVTSPKAYQQDDKGKSPLIALRSEHHRLRVFEGTPFSWIDLDPIFQLGAVLNFPRLEYFHLTVYSRLFRHVSDDSFDAPNLISLSLRGDASRLLHGLTVKTRSNLRHLTYEATDGPSCRYLQLLSKMENLISLEWLEDLALYERQLFPKQFQSVQLQHLKIFALNVTGWWGFDHTIRFLERIEMPSLEQLSIVGPGFENEVPFPINAILLAIVKDYSPSFRYLKIQSCNLSAINVPQILSPFLHSGILVIRDSYLEAPFFESLINFLIEDLDSRYSNRLKKMEIELCRKVAVPHDRLHLKRCILKLLKGSAGGKRHESINLSIRDIEDCHPELHDLASSYRSTFLYQSG